MNYARLTSGNDRQNNHAVEEPDTAAETGAGAGAGDAATVTKSAPFEPVVVGLFHDPLDGTGSRSLPISPLRVDTRGYSQWDHGYGRS